MKKRIFVNCFLAVSLLFGASCNDFLTEDPQGRLTPDNFFSNQNELNMSVYALYAKVQELQCNSNPMIPQCQGDDVTSTTGSNKAIYRPCQQGYKAKKCVFYPFFSQKIL